MTGKTEFLKSEDGLKLFSRWYIPNDKPRAILIFIHGIGEHSGRYHSWIERFLKLGHAAMAFDHRGHGRSEGKRGHIPSMEMVLNDMDIFVEKVRHDFQDIPVILYGHSLGGNFVLNYLTRRSPEISCSIVTSPWLTLVKNVPGPVVSLMHFLNKLAPGLVLTSTVKPKSISRDRQVIEAYENDPLTHKKISVRLFCEAHETGTRIMRHAEKVTVPLLLMHAGADLITDPNSSEQFARGNPGQIQFKLWPGLYHEIHNEERKDEVFQYAVEWLKKHLK
jgi:alpha-beta hydrolase superfamily lysophospholipase